MLAKDNKLDFTGQHIYAGLDVHNKDFKVTILGEKVYHKTYTQPPEAEVLANYLKRNFPGADYHAAYEAGFSGFWLQEQLTSFGINCIVVNPSDIPTTDKEKKQKQDKRDSRKIARSLRNNELEAIYIPSKQGQFDRTLVRVCQKIKGNLRRCKNRIKSMLYFYGIRWPSQFKKPGTHWSKRFMTWLEGVDLGNESGNDALQALITEAHFLRKHMLDITRKINALSRSQRYDKQVKLLITVPGIGRWTAMIFLTEIEDIFRFKSLDKLCAYIGLIPNTRSSGDKEGIGPMTKRGNGILKNHLIESAWMALGKDPALMMKFNELCETMKGNKAVVRIARKLISRIRYVLVHEVEYQKGVVT
jgi:transposase